MNKTPTPTQTTKIKWEVVYEDEDCISVWKYDTRKTINGPVEVEYKWKRGYTHPLDKKKTLGDLAKEAKKEAKLKKSQS
jgi:hypothetical protein